MAFPYARRSGRRAAAAHRRASTPPPADFDLIEDLDAAMALCDPAETLSTAAVQKVCTLTSFPHV
eukprot:m.29633 g.29633  ORF g.29633 m.29633 type:complete len:65 (+) comp9206_c0_seq2:488-682(+)